MSFSSPEISFLYFLMEARCCFWQSSICFSSCCFSFSRLWIFVSLVNNSRWRAFSIRECMPIVWLCKQLKTFTHGCVVLQGLSVSRRSSGPGVTSSVMMMRRVNLVWTGTGQCDIASCTGVSTFIGACEIETLVWITWVTEIRRSISVVWNQYSFTPM